MSRVLGVIAILAVLTGVADAQVRGYVVMSGAERSDVLVSLVDHNGRIIHQAFTGARGQFRLEGVSVLTIDGRNPAVYIVINEEGYQPHRELILQSDLRSGGRAFVIYLEEEEPELAVPPESEGIVDVRQLQADIPDAAFDAYDQALDAVDAGDHSLAIERLEFAVELAPEYYDAWLDLAAQYEHLDRWDDSVAAYIEATEVNPGGALAHLNLGALLYQQGDRARGEGNPDGVRAFSIARQWLNKAIQLDPTSSAAGFYLGATLYRLESYDESEEWLQRSIVMDAGHAPAARSMLINVYARQNRYVAAHEQAVMFLEDYPEAAEYEAIERAKAQLEIALGL
jgi:tetratricopeptide (TPR) repeat protein